MKQTAIYLTLLLVTLFMSACDEDNQNNGTSETPEVCDDGIDNDGDGATDCADVECNDACSDSDSSGNTGEGDVSGMPIPETSGVPKPDGTPGNLSVLDWAGFTAAVSYTFDDSQPTHISHYDELNAEGIRMTFFAATGSPSSAADYDTTFAQAVTDGHEIGNHTAHHCHIDLTGCSFGTADETPAAEIEECSTYILDNFGQAEVWTMASPFGDGGWATPAADYFFLNRSVSSGRIAPNSSTNPFALPSIMLSGGETVDDINSIIDTTYDQGAWHVFCFHSVLPGANWYAGVELESITGSMEHIKDAGDIWADSMVNVGAYWMGQKLVTDASPTTSGDTTTWTWTLPDHFPAGKYVRVTVDGGTLSQGGTTLAWSDHGYYEVSLDAGELVLAP